MYAKPRYLILFLLCCMSVYAASAQVLLRTSLDRNAILIGEPVRLHLEARYPLGQTIQWVRTDSLPRLEILAKDSVKIIETMDGKQMSQDWTLTGYDTGYIVLPSLRVWVAGKEVYSDTIGLQVNYDQPNTDADYRDIKPLEEVERNWPLKQWVLGGSGLLLLLLLLFWLLRKRRKPVPVAPPVDVPAVEWAQTSLLALKKEWEGGRVEVKEFYSRLTDIFRIYVSKEKGWTTSEKTSAELILKLRSLPLSPQQFSDISETLRAADMVKFAKYVPEHAESFEHWNRIDHAIRAIHTLKMNERAV